MPTFAWGEAWGECTEYTQDTKDDTEEKSGAEKKGGGEGYCDSVQYTGSTNDGFTCNGYR